MSDRRIDRFRSPILYFGVGFAVGLISPYIPMLLIILLVSVGFIRYLTIC